MVIKKTKTIYKSQRQNMFDFFLTGLENSKEVFVVNYDSKKLSFIDFLFWKGSLERKVSLVLVNGLWTYEKLVEFEQDRIFNGNSIATVFYKDGVNYLNYLGVLATHVKSSRSLKKYDNCDLRRVFQMSKLEGYVLEQNNGYLQYFQPSMMSSNSHNFDCVRMDSCLRGYRLDSVLLDYTHIDREGRTDSQGNATKIYPEEDERIAKSYKIAVERQRGVSPFNVKFCCDIPNRAFLIPLSSLI